MQNTALSTFLEWFLELLSQYGPLVVALMVLYFVWKLVGIIRKS